MTDATSDPTPDPKADPTSDPTPDPRPEPKPDRTHEMLFRALRDMVPERDLDALLEKVIRTSTQILEADRALLFLFDPATEALVFRYGVNIDAETIEEAHQFSSSVLEKAMRGEVVMTSDSQGDDDLSEAESLRMFDIRMVLCAPIRSNERLIGVIYADTRGSETFLDDEKRAYFLSFVDFIASVIEGAIERHDKAGELAYLKRRLAEETLFPEIVGQSASIRTVKEKILRLASVDYPVSVLILGESGSGKELIARAIHQAGARSDRPFIAVNCAAIPPTLIESELFGHEKGAFTGALSRKPGFYEMADGGVIFLDEIGDLPTELQPKLLRVLQFGTFSRVGGRVELTADVQVVCATSKDLYREMEENRFRKALFHRLAVEAVRVPALRERREDVLLLASHFMRHFAQAMGKSLTGIEGGAQRLLEGHDYGENNVRELKNIIQRAVLAAEGKQIRAADIVFSDELLFGPEGRGPAPGSEGAGGPGDPGLIRIDEGRIARLLEDARAEGDVEKSRRPYYRVHEEMERQLIFLSLRQSGWKIKPAASLLGINHLNLRGKLTALLSECVRACDDDLPRASREYGIPLAFLKARIERASIDRKGDEK